MATAALNMLPQRRALPLGSAEIFRQWQREALLANFNKFEYAAAFEDFWTAQDEGDCVLHALLCEWTRLLREENRAFAPEVDVARRQLSSAA